MSAVELVEADGPEAAGDGAPGAGAASAGARGRAGREPGGREPAGGGPGGRRGRTGAPRRPWRAVAAVVAALAVGAAAVADARDAARVSTLRGLPGVLRPVDGPLTTVWTSDRRLGAPLWPAGDLLVGVEDVWDGSRDVTVVALRRATGRTAWSTPVIRDATTPVGGVRCVVPDAPAGGDGTDRVVVCLSLDELGPDPQDLAQLEPRRARLLVLAVATGEVLEERPVDPSTSLDVLGEDVVVKDVVDDGRVRVRRTDARVRDVRWTFHGHSSPRVPGYALVRTDDGLVVVAGEAGWVLSGDGGVVHAWPPARPAAAGWGDVLRGRVLVLPRRDVLGSTEVVELGTGRSFTADGYAPGLSVDDGSAGDVVLVQSARGEGLVAHRLGSGRPRWTVPGEDAGGALVLDGRVVRATSDRLQAVDARTGATVWSAPSVAGRAWGLHTDGRLVVRAEREAARGAVLVARGLDDGRVRWTGDVTDDLEHLVAVDGRLLGLTSGGTVAFGPAPG